MKRPFRLNLFIVLMFCGLFLFSGMSFYSDAAYCETEGEEEEIQTHENPMKYSVQKRAASRQTLKNSGMLNVNDGEGPGGDKPLPVTQQIRSSGQSQTMRSQTIKPSA